MRLLLAVRMKLEDLKAERVLEVGGSCRLGRREVGVEVLGDYVLRDGRIRAGRLSQGGRGRKEGMSGERRSRAVRAREKKRERVVPECMRQSLLLEQEVGPA